MGKHESGVLVRSYLVLSEWAWMKCMIAYGTTLEHGLASLNFGSSVRWNVTPLPSRPNPGPRSSRNPHCPNPCVPLDNVPTSILRAYRAPSARSSLGCIAPARKWGQGESCYPLHKFQNGPTERARRSLRVEHSLDSLPRRLGLTIRVEHDSHDVIQSTHSLST